MAYKEQLQENNARISAIAETLANKFTGAIKVEGIGIDGGYLRYVSETGNAETVLPDAEVNSVSENVPTSSAVAKYVSAVVSTLNSFKKEIVTALPTENIDENTIYLVLKTSGAGNDYYDEYLYINGNFEFIGSTQVDLTGYIKNTDYADVNKFGIVKLAASSGIGIDSVEKYLKLYRASESDINNKTGMNVIVPSNLDTAVKVGLTTNTKTLTEEEKASVHSWLGVPQFTATQLEDGSYSLSITTPTEA